MIDNSDCNWRLLRAVELAAAVPTPILTSTTSLSYFPSSSTVPAFGSNQKFTINATPKQSFGSNNNNMPAFPATSGFGSISSFAAAAPNPFQSSFTAAPAPKYGGYNNSKKKKYYEDDDSDEDMDGDEDDEQFEEEYSVEYAKSNRSTCKSCGSKIENKALRFGVTVQGDGGYPITSWHHAECLKLSSRGISSSNLQGLSSLKADDKKKIKTILGE